jgi:hypothetical protein
MIAFTATLTSSYSLFYAAAHVVQAKHLVRLEFIPIIAAVTSSEVKMSLHAHN